MHLIKKVTINKPIQEVWRVWAEKFDKAQDWMAVVVHSFEKKEGNKTENSPMIGRICEFSAKENGPKVLEDILQYDEKKYLMDIKVVPQNVPLPLKYNLLKSSMRKVSDQQTEITLDISPVISWKGYLLYPLLRGGLSKSFNELLEELKYFLEKGQPHPRKLSKMKGKI